jgi:Leucine-rich repeat (LRR) protein
VLDISNNSIPSLPPTCSYSVLREFNMSHNLIQSIPDCYASIGSLEECNLSFNQLTTLPTSFSKSRAYLQVYLSITIYH